MIRALVLLVVLLVPASAVTGQQMTGDQLLLRSSEAYAELMSYSGTTSVISEISVGDTTIVQASSADVYFSRPGHYRIEGSDINGNPYRFTADGTRTHLRLVAGSSRAAQMLSSMLNGRSMGDTVSVEAINMEDAIAALTGISNRAAFYFPSLTGAVGVRLDPGVASEIVGRAPCGLDDCYVVEIDSPLGHITYWIDTRTMLIRQLLDVQGPAENARHADALSQADSVGYPPAAMDLLKSASVRSKYLVTFTDHRVDERLDDALFDVPVHTPVQPPQTGI